MRTCLRCHSEMVEHCAVKVEGAGYGIVLATDDRKLFPNRIGQPRVAELRGGLPVSGGRGEAEGMTGGACSEAQKAREGFPSRAFVWFSPACGRIAGDISTPRRRTGPMRTVRPAGRLSQRNRRTAAALSAEIGPYGCAADWRISRKSPHGVKQT